jgi:ribosomal protein L32
VLGRGAPCTHRHGLVTVAPAARTSARRRAWRRALQDRTEAATDAASCGDVLQGHNIKFLTVQ